jgi:hypothetical protein
MEDDMAQNEPNAPATPDQEHALMSATNVDVSQLSLTKKQASKLLDEVAVGREPTVRKALILYGGVPVGELPDVDEVGVSHKLGRTVLYLPRGVELPRHDGKVIAEQVPQGILIKVVDAPRSPGRNA